MTDCHHLKLGISKCYTQTLNGSRKLHLQNQQKERRPHLLGKPLHKNHRWQTWRGPSQRTH